MSFPRCVICYSGQIGCDCPVFVSDTPAPVKLHRDLRNEDGVEVVESTASGLPGAHVWVARSIGDGTVDTRSLIFEEHIKVFRKNFPDYTFEVA